MGGGAGFPNMNIRGMISRMRIGHYLRENRFEIAQQILLSIIVATLVSSSVSYYVNVRLDERVTERQFIYDYSRVFFDDPKYRNVSTALEEEYLYGKKFLKPDGTSFSDYDIDDYLYLL